MVALPIANKGWCRCPAGWNGDDCSTRQRVIPVQDFGKTVGVITLLNNLPQPLALRYHGHQFRVYNPDIGDGRGFLFAQLRDHQGRLNQQIAGAAGLVMGVMAGLPMVLKGHLPDGFEATF